MVVFRQSGCVRVRWLYSGKEFVIGQNWLYSKKVVVIGQKWLYRHSKTSFEKNCFSAWASTLNMGLINKVDMVCLSPVGYGV